MSISDYEIMGGIGYGGDGVSMNLSDIKSLILSEQPVPTKESYWKPTPFAAGAELGRPRYIDPYEPIEQEPMGRSYRPDSVGYSGKKTNPYEYPAWNPDAPITGIAYERDSIAGSNSLAVEDYFQTETARFGDSRSINESMPKDGRLNAYDLFSASISGIKEKMTDTINDSLNAAQVNYNILIVLLFIVFIVVAYLQHRQIVKLQKIIGKSLRQ
jgi:hypothetical protein